LCGDSLPADLLARSPPAALLVVRGRRLRDLAAAVRQLLSRARLRSHPERLRGLRDLRLDDDAEGEPWKARRRGDDRALLVCGDRGLQFRLRIHRDERLHPRHPLSRSRFLVRAEPSDVSRGRRPSACAHLERSGRLSRGSLALRLCRGSLVGPRGLARPSLALRIAVAPGLAANLGRPPPRRSAADSLCVGRLPLAPARYERGNDTRRVSAVIGYRTAFGGSCSTPLPASRWSKLSRAFKT